MKIHIYGEVKTDSATGRQWHQCKDCGQVDPVDNNSMHNRYCFSGLAEEEKRAEDMFRKDK